MCEEWMHMAKDREQLMREIEELKVEVQSIKAEPQEEVPQAAEESISSLMKYMIEERERTNQRLEELTQKMARLRSAVESMYLAAEPPQTVHEEWREGNEIPLSVLDTAVVNLVQSRGMICADELKEFMRYKGRNAACARLGQLYNKGLLERHQLGHKVYYRYAGKATNALIISPPQ